MSAAQVVQRVRSLGIVLSSHDGKLRYESPAGRLTPELRAALVLHRAAILAFLDAERRVAASKVADADLSDFRVALMLGRLHVCCNCRQFEFADDPAALGHCRRFNVEAWPFAPFWCSGFQTARRPVAPEYLPIPNRTDGGKMGVP